jgi:hypothetical protein
LDKLETWIDAALSKVEASQTTEAFGFIGETLETLRLLETIRTQPNPAPSLQISARSSALDLKILGDPNVPYTLMYAPSLAEGWTEAPGVVMSGTTNSVNGTGKAGYYRAVLR